ncbi:nuA4 complex subunit EAF3-like protein [Pyrus ussuriensis x Pyrus communis]|uniref:NuA4 complex subunit EAF3-like protein n=1 Tax=Pyrus ussuriensis x Pyrus communis TaxID=2448454 RepID=A0A5N5GZX3_9ROSA|nr:nuA4 complex subunit EAF3-like protein [Pyrus ussuriensis x Pyrus communis]
MRRKGSKSKTAESHITDTDSSATESDSSAIKIDSDMIHDENYDASPPSPRFLPLYRGREGPRLSQGTTVTDVRYKMDWEFYVHYAGWNKSRDEWARLDRLTKNTDKNKKKHQYLNQKQGTDKNAKLTHTAHTKPKTSRGKKRKNDSVCKDKGAIPMEDLVLQMPQTLKKQLVDDCEFITHLGKLVKLPRTPNVDDIFKKYLDYRSKDTQSVEEILKGLCCYFDKALPAMLLYKNERQQYEKAITDDVSPSSVYGAEHLLRPFVKLPELLLDANTEEETSKALQQKLTILKPAPTNQMSKRRHTCNIFVHNTAEEQRLMMSRHHFEYFIGSKSR